MCGLSYLELSDLITFFFKVLYGLAHKCLGINVCMGLHVFNTIHLYREIVNGQDGCSYQELGGVNMMPRFLMLVP